MLYVDLANTYINDPWVTGDDFNSLLRVKETIGGDQVLVGEILDFATCIENCGMQ